MDKTYVSYNNIVSSLGFDSATVVAKVKNQESGLSLVNNKAILPTPFYASVIDNQKLNTAYAALQTETAHTRLEKMLLLSLQDVITKSNISITPRTGLIISTTKGNVDALENNTNFSEDKSYLSSIGTTLAKYFGFTTAPIVVSNACISGVLAVAIAKRFIDAGRFDEVLITSGDVLSKFIVSGFNSFQALSPEQCKPYDTDRKGINIGEVAASILVTSSNKNLAPEAVTILGDSSCNDANHISGPSRTGEGLYRSIHNALQEAKIPASKIQYISAHGTATTYNDEMEAIAFNRVGLSTTPINSLKGYFGHTLGASGLLETIIGMHSLHQNTLFASLGFSALGVSQPLQVITKPTPQKLTTFFKTASGFGGCNAAMVFKKV